MAAPTGTRNINLPAAAENLSTEPALLVSYVYLKSFQEHRAEYVFRDWALDSGAFSAHHRQLPIALEDYIATCQQLLATDPLLTEVFALDVIGDHVASQRNCERMWEAGVPAIPTYHHGEPEAVLTSLAKSYPKIALGGAVGLRAQYKLRWAEQCFARVWPKAIHGFGFGSETHILALPFHSVDATNWESGPCRFGNWITFGTMSVRGSDQNLRGEVEHFLTIEEKARARWRKQMAQLARVGPDVRLAMGWEGMQQAASGLAPLSVRLAVADSRIQKQQNSGLNPTVRLAMCYGPGQRNGTFAPVDPKGEPE